MGFGCTPKARMRTGNRAFRCSSGHSNAKAPVLPGLRRKWGCGSLSQSRARRYNTPARAASSVCPVCPVCRGLLPTLSRHRGIANEQPVTDLQRTARNQQFGHRSLALAQQADGDRIWRVLGLVPPPRPAAATLCRFNRRMGQCCPAVRRSQSRELRGSVYNRRQGRFSDLVLCTRLYPRGRSGLRLGSGELELCQLLGQVFAKQQMGETR